MAKRIYVETTIISYLSARPSRDLIVAAHQQITRDWWDTRRREYELYISQVVLREAKAGDEEASRRRLELLDGLPLLAINEEAVRLASALTESGPLPTRAADDAFHLALATVHGMNFLLTWNCRHLANAELTYQIQEELTARGFRAPVICTPEELSGI
jgi:predicted nucleic acid-binding protein